MAQLREQQGVRIAVIGCVSLVCAAFSLGRNLWPFHPIQTLKRDLFSMKTPASSKPLHEVCRKAEMANLIVGTWSAQLHLRFRQGERRAQGLGWSRPCNHRR